MDHTMSISAEAHRRQGRGKTNGRAFVDQLQGGPAIVVSNAAWCLSADDVMRQWQTLLKGLIADTVRKRLEQYGGPNQLPEATKPGLAIIFVHPFLNPLIYILFAAAIVSLEQIYCWR